MNADARRRLLIALAAGGVGLFFFDVFVLRPLGSMWDDHTERIALSGEQVERGTQLLDRKDSTQQRWDAMRQGSLPRDTARAETGVLDAIGAWSRTSGLRVSNIRPRWVAMRGVGDRFEVRLSGEGDMEKIARFLYELETDNLPLAVEESLIRSRGESGNDLILEVRFSALRIGGAGT